MPKKGCRYNWRDLELISWTTITNIITFIQFAIIPLTNKSSGSSTSSSLVSLDFSGLKTLLLSPLEFITVFLKIATPLRVLIFAHIIMGFINLVILSIFFPSWRSIVLFCDFFSPYLSILPAVCQNCGTSGSSIAIMVVGFLYLAIRIAIMLYMVIKQCGKNWYEATALEESAIFFARISHTDDPEALKKRHEDLHTTIWQNDVAINSKVYPNKNRLIDIIVACVWALILIIIIWAVGIDTIFSSLVDSSSKSNFKFFVNIFLITFFIFACVRIICSIFYYTHIGENSLQWMRRMAFKVFVILSGLVLLPVLNLILESTSTVSATCDYMQYYDYQTNQTDFLSYFEERNGVGCQTCTNASFAIARCASRCVYNGTFSYVYVSNAAFISEDDLTSVYTMPIAILEIFFLVFFLQMIRNIFINSKMILENMPSPSLSVETKFSSLVQNLNTTGAYLFGSYRHHQAFYYFNFTQIKLFVLFFTSLLPIFPVEAVRPYSAILIPAMFTIVSGIITMMSVFSHPYKSVLHNLTNIFSYLLAAIASLISTLKAAGMNIPTIVGNILLVLIFVLPFVIALVVPFWAKFDKRLRKIPYNLKDILKKDKYIFSDVSKKRRKEISSSSESENEDEKKEVPLSDNDEDGGELKVSDFDTHKIAPIHVQMGIDVRKKGYQSLVSQIYHPIDIVEKEFNDASTDMLEITDELLDATSYQGLTMVLNVGTLICGACCAWGIGGGLSQWKSKTADSILKCDWANTSEIPSYYSSFT